MLELAFLVLWGGLCYYVAALCRGIFLCEIAARNGLFRVIGVLFWVLGT